jgi:molecular chaperone GrpE
MTGEFDDVREEDMEVVPSETEEQAGGPAAAATEVERLTRELEKKTKEAAEANEKYLRSAADFDNFRKRMQRDLAESRKYANEQLALELLTVVDHLGLAIKHAGEAGEAAQGLREGVELVYKQFRDVLEKFGVTAFGAEGEAFDPARHDAMMQVSTDEVPENTVVQVMQDGYLYYEKVLRHAKVSVSKRPEEEKSESESNTNS